MSFFFAIFLLSMVPVFVQLAADPSAGILTSKSKSRNLECTPLTTAGMRIKFPEEVDSSHPRGDFIKRDAVICHEPMLSLQNRGGVAETKQAQNHLILNNLSSYTAEIATLAQSATQDFTATHKNVIWHVETFYPDAAMTAKISFAAKIALTEQGVLVSDSTPVLAAGDIYVLARMQPDKSYPLACKRYFDHGSLSSKDILLGIVLKDSRETILHAGLCVNGAWQWIR